MFGSRRCTTVATQNNKYTEPGVSTRSEITMRPNRGFKHKRNVRPEFIQHAIKQTFIIITGI